LALVQETLLFSLALLTPHMQLALHSPGLKSLSAMSQTNGQKTPS
jgi:hypothetical protein